MSIRDDIAALMPPGDPASQERLEFATALIDVLAEVLVAKVGAFEALSSIPFVAQQTKLSIVRRAS